MTQIIAISNLKGGVGKSTISINLSGYLAKSSKVLLVDADPQGSIITWLNLRIKHNPENKLTKNLVVSDSSFSLEELKPLKHKFESYDYIIIDCPPEDAVIMRTALVVSNLVIIPVAPSPFDIGSTEKTISTINEGLASKAIKVKPYILVSQKATGTVLGREIKDALKIYKFPILKTEVYRREILKTAIIYGQTIFEYSSASKSTKEFTKLGKEIKKCQKN
jgi:chromosome partitioning protein